VRALYLSLLVGVSMLVAGASEPASARSGSGSGGSGAVEDDGLDTPDEPDAPDAPDALDEPDAPDAPDAPEPDAPDAPEPDAPEPEQGGAGSDGATASEGGESSGPGSDGGGGGGGSSGSGSGGDDPTDEASNNGGGSSGPGSGGAAGDDNSGSGSDSNSGSGSGGGGSENSGSSSGSNSSASNSSGQGSGTPDAAELVQRHLSGPIEIAIDESGREHLVGEALMLGTAADVGRAAESGYRLISETRSGDRVVARLLVPATHTIGQAIGDLRALAPRAIVTVNTAYRSTQATRSAGAASPPARPPRRSAVLGIIDTGADPHVAAAGGFIATHGFGPSGYLPREHGSAVASIASARGLRVRVADVFGATRSGEAVASASAIAAALQWMLDADVVVVNISVEGPHNQVIEHLINEAARGGHVIVAAAGNGGPLAEPAFPGAYEGALAVTAVDGAGRAYLRANRGDYIDFAALGVDVSVDTGEGPATVSGTSFAAPLVAALIAEELPRASAAEAARVINRLRQRAIDRGRAGRDSIYGWGEVRAD
jgi:minor extracellular protease Epr